MTGGSHKEVNIWASPQADRPPPPFGPSAVPGCYKNRVILSGTLLLFNLLASLASSRVSYVHAPCCDPHGFDQTVASQRRQASVLRHGNAWNGRPEGAGSRIIHGVIGCFIA